MDLYSTIKDVNGGARNDLHVIRMSCDVPPRKRQCSRGADLLTLSKYCINKHLTRSKHKRQAAAWEHIIVCK